ncbi:M14 family metallopeptidase [Flavivirga spongiicola]|uniref:M14 family metallopeptidase n=1 Tax=Flavivirga spongiicola TaxID=421621 RepID=A0ABU7Y0W8_9FLAO|nr:M14 family metallopeptidase [Flavivirga sp. MEBiC05379]MDO5980779.1 M14 family metallopeptidase [Flavivirga sp. MEBiC05379]
MKLNLFFQLSAWCICLCFSPVLAQQNYRNNEDINKALRNLVNNHKSHASLKSLTKTLGGKDVWVLTLSNGKPEAHPAIVIAGGVSGNHLLGIELSVKMAERILTNYKSVLNQTTFYIFPNLSPDATAQYFGKLKYERVANAKKTDDDRDGSINEDGFEDLNNDKLITLIRVEDPTGDYMPLEEDPRIMVKANPQKGEKGTHKIFSEGIDNDKDGVFNEDGIGGVAFNKNLTYNYPYFKSGAGEHAVSELENRALLDFLYERWNIHSILTFGPSNNLSVPLKYNSDRANKRIITSILKKDEKLNKHISEIYNKITKTKDAPKSVTAGGGFFEWSYFHFGRHAMSTPAWWFPKFEGDSLVKAPKNRKANFLKWAEQEGIENTFVEWTSIKHPDFPNKKVEVGGIVPFIMDNPPYSKVDSIAIKHSEFIIEIAKIQPDLKLINLKTEDLGSNLTRITVDLYNKGLLPTHTEMGAKSKWLRKINVSLKLGKGQEVLSGKKRLVLGIIEEDSSKQLSWLIKGRGKLQIEATTPHAGKQSITINL